MPGGRVLPRVLLIQSDAAIAAGWEAGLARCTIRVVSDEATLERAVAEHAPDVVIGEWSEALIQRLRDCRPTLRFVHFAPTLSVEVVEATARGHEVFHVDRVDDLAAKVEGLVRTVRAGLRQAVDGLEVTWTGGGAFPVIDLSSDGVAFVVASGVDVAQLLPGAVLADAVVRRGSVVVIDGIVAHVRRIDVRDCVYHVGCELRRAHREHRSPKRSIDDRALCGGLVHSALRAGSLVLVDPARDALIQCDGGSVDPSRGDVAVTVAEHPFRVFDIVDGQFELSDGAYQFRTVVCRVAPLALKVPTVIEETRRRATVRWRPPRLTAALTSALGSAPVERAIHDLSTTGMSFEAHPEDVVPFGLHLPQIDIGLGGRVVRLSGQIRSVVRGARGRRCGIRFDAMDDATRGVLQDAIVRASFPGLDSGRTTSFDELWRFFVDAGLITAAKQAQLAAMLPEVRRTYAALTAGATALAGSVVVRDRGAMIAYCGGLRAYQSTWMFHHLAAVRGKHTGTLVSIGATEHLLQCAEYDYFRMWFFADAPFPRRVFGGFARMVSDPARSSLRCFAHFHVPTTRRFGDTDGLAVGAASAEDLAAVERFFIATESPLIVGAEDLTLRGLDLADVDRHYRDAGLARRRHVLVARSGATPVGFALAELSSPGLNLSETMSSFRLFVLPAGAHDRQRARRGLLDATLALYAASGRGFGRCLIDPRDADEFAALGVVLDAGRSMCWTSHRTQLRPFADHMRRLFELLARPADQPDAIIARAASRQSTRNAP